MSSVDEDVEIALPGLRVKSRLPLVAYRRRVPIVECTNRYDMVCGSQAAVLNVQQVRFEIDVALFQMR